MDIVLTFWVKTYLTVFKSILVAIIFASSTHNLQSKDKQLNLIQFKPFVYSSVHTDLLRIYPFLPSNYYISGNSKLVGLATISKKYNYLNYEYNFNLDWRLGVGLRVVKNKNDISILFGSIMNQYYNLDFDFTTERKEHLYKQFYDSQIYSIEYFRNIISQNKIKVDMGLNFQFEYFKSPNSLNFRKFNFNIPANWSEKSYSYTISIIPRISYPIRKSLIIHFKCFPYLTYFEAYPVKEYRLSHGKYANYRFMIELNYNFK